MSGRWKGIQRGASKADRVLGGLEGLSAEADTADQEREGKDDALYCALQKLVYMIWDPLVLLFPFWHLLFIFHLLFLVVFLSVALLLRVCCSVSFCVSSVYVLVSFSRLRK